MSRLKRLIQEIHRRSLWQVLGIYLGGAWVTLQGVEALVSVLGLAKWLPGFALVVLTLGLASCWPRPSVATIRTSPRPTRRSRCLPRNAATPRQSASIRVESGSCGRHAGKATKPPSRKTKSPDGTLSQNRRTIILNQIRYHSQRHKRRSRDDQDRLELPSAWMKDLWKDARVSCERQD